MRKIFKILLLALISICLIACSSNTNSNNVDNQDSKIYDDINVDSSDVNYIVLNEDSATFNGNNVSEFNYTWNIDPSKEEPWHEGDEPSGDVYIAHDIIYYPELNEDGFSKENYDGETEWVYHYTAEGLEDYIFSTLPVLGDDLPNEMMHSAVDAYNNKVLHITKAGTYNLSGTWHGQIYIDLGEDAFSDETQKVTIILDNANVTCDVASAIVFKNVYEADNTWEDKESYSGETNIGEMQAGATVIIKDGTINNFTGANVYRLLKAKYKTDSTTVQKKYCKIDGAFYSYMSMNINGQENNSGILNITSTTFEGLDTELHLGINGGVINIHTQDDGINVNEDYVSVITINGGRLTILAGLGAEGDAIDSNGYITINGGEVFAIASPYSDNGLDSESGTAINGGTVVALGSNMMGSAYTVYIDGQQQYQESNTGNMFNPQGQGNQMPNNENFDPSQMGNFDPSQVGGEPPNGNGGPGNMPGNMPPNTGNNQGNTDPQN